MAFSLTSLFVLALNGAGTLVEAAHARNVGSHGVDARHSSSSSYTGPTSHVLKLRKSDVRSSSSKHLTEFIKRSSAAPGGTTNHMTHLSDVQGLDFAATVQFDGKPFDVLVDTGSADLWLATTDAVCVNSNGTSGDIASCNMGPGFDGTFSGGEMPNNNFNVTYGSGAASGKAGKEKITLAGITVENQIVGLVDNLNWDGDGRCSGLMGLQGLGAGLYNGTDLSKDNDKNQVDYPSLITNMWKDGSIPPVFSLAQERHSGDGWLALGGLPPVETGPFASAPMSQSGINKEYNYAFYNVLVDALVYGKAEDQKSKRHLKITRSKHSHRSTGLTKKPLNSSMVVDSGTQIVLLPPNLAEPILDLYDPPAQFVPHVGNFGVQCNATPPYFGVQIGGRVFDVNKADMIMQHKKLPGTDLCAPGVGPISLPFSILGDTFLNNVVAVFDIGAGKMRFAEHRY